MPSLRILKRDPLAYTENAFAPNATAFIYFLDGSSINDIRVQIAEKSPFYSALNRCLMPDTEMPEYLADWDYLASDGTIGAQIVERVSGFAMLVTSSTLLLQSIGDAMGQPIETQSVKTLTDSIKTLAMAYRLRDTAPLTIEV
jgi:hypothetical protein